MSPYLVAYLAIYAFVLGAFALRYRRLWKLALLWGQAEQAARVRMHNRLLQYQEQRATDNQRWNERVEQTRALGQEAEARRLEAVAEIGHQKMRVRVLERQLALLREGVAGERYPTPQADGEP